MSAILLEDDIVHYEVLGRGRPLLLLHSWVGSWRYWIPTMQSTSVGYRAYALDLWGFGDTAKNKEQYSLDSQVLLLEKFLDQMGIMRIALIGHGLGAVVALRYALQHSNIVDRVMVVGYPMDANLISDRLYHISTQEMLEWVLVREPQTEPVWVDAPKTDSQAVATCLDNLKELELQGTWRNVEMPCLLVHGQNDPVTRLPDGENLTNMPDHAHLITFELSGHFPMLDNSNKFSRLLLDFLSLDSGASPQQLQLKEQWKRRVR